MASLAQKQPRMEAGHQPSLKPWIEKYRPKTLDDVQSQSDVVNALKACLQAGSNMPHLLFYGPPGTGKTSSILAVARELFGPDYMKARVRELNASDDRGIAVIREKVKTFAHGAASHVAGKVQSDGRVYPVPSFKLVILDEADALLPDAQAALRRMMEDFSEVTRFCILCNYVSRIIDPIASRCAKFRFKPLTKDSIYERIRMVADAEGLVVSDDSLRRLDSAAGGDLRLAIMHLQSAAKAHGSDLSKEDFVMVSGAVPDTIFADYLAAIHKSFDAMLAATDSLVKQGFSALQVLQQVHRFLVSRDCTLGAAARGALCLKLSETEKRLMDRGDDFLQLLDFGASFVKVATRT